MNDEPPKPLFQSYRESFRNFSFKSLFTKLKDLKEIIIEYTILTVTYLFYPFSSKLLFPYLLALDGVFSTVAFLRLHSDNLTQSQIIEKIGSIYNIDLIDRYIYYIGLSLIYEYLRIVFWLNQYQTYYLMFFLLASLGVPNQINKLCKTWLNPSFSMLGKLRVRISRTICAFILARIMNFLSLICVDLRPNIRTAELYPLMKTATLSNTPKTLLNFLIATLVQYTQNNGRTMSSKLIRVVYRYNTGKKIATVKSEEQAKEKIVKVLVERRFNELIRPDTLQTVFYLYQTKEDGLLYTFFTEFEYRVLQIGTVFTLTKNILNLPAYVAAFFSICLVLYRVLYTTVEHRPLSNSKGDSDNINSKAKDSKKDDSSNSVEGHEIRNPTSDILSLKQDEKHERNERIVRMMIGRVLGLFIGFFLPEDYLLVTLVSELTYYLIIQFEMQLLRIKELFYASFFQELYNELSNMTPKIILSKINHETRYLLVSLLVSSHWYSLLGALVLAPNLITSSMLLFQALLLRISGYNWSHFCLFLVQSLFYQYYSPYLTDMIQTLRDLQTKKAQGKAQESMESPIDSISFIQHLDASYHPITDRLKDSPQKNAVNAVNAVNAINAVKYPTNNKDAAITERVEEAKEAKESREPKAQKSREPQKSKELKELRKSKIDKNLNDMNDEEIEKAIDLISSQNLPSPDKGPVITDEATEAMMRSLRNKGVIPDLDKSIYLGSVSSHLNPELVPDSTEEASELYSEY